MRAINVSHPKTPGLCRALLPWFCSFGFPAMTIDLKNVRIRELK